MNIQPTVVPQPDWEFFEHEYYKYRLTDDYRHMLWYFDPADSATITDNQGRTWATLDAGMLHIRRYYAWDGPSGPAVDTMNLSAPSLVHDCLIQMVAAGLLPRRPWKEYADKEYHVLSRAMGVNRFRAWLQYLAIRYIGKARYPYLPP